jgi:hypothetical protein
MPIRFRCPTCTGLMSIARRKANATVACPKCGEQVIVPPADAALPTDVADEPADDRPLFERTDFDSLLSRAGVAAAPTPAKPVEKAVPVTAKPAAEIVLSYPAAGALAAGCAALVAGGFAAGYWLR